MVTRITKKELKRLQSKAPSSVFGKTYTATAWIAEDGKAYKTDKKGIEAAKEMIAHAKQIKKNRDSQLSLL